MQMNRTLTIPALCMRDGPSACGPATQQVDGGEVHLNGTLFERNSAPDGGGGSIQVSRGAVRYSLPAPPGRWLSIRQGFTLELQAGSAEDLDFPYVCPAGVVGGSSPWEQVGPACSRMW